MELTDPKPQEQARASVPIWKDAAVCELDGPRITGPITSLKMLVAFEAHSSLIAVMGNQCTATGNRCQVRWQRQVWCSWQSIALDGIPSAGPPKTWDELKTGAHLVERLQVSRFHRVSPAPIAFVLIM